jgi:hypothetical protein
MRRVKLYEVKFREVMAFDRVDIHYQSMPVEKLKGVYGSDEVLLDYGYEKIDLPVYTVNEFTNGSISEDFLAIHPSLSKLLIPNILHDSCLLEYERACERSKNLDEQLRSTRKDLEKVKQVRDDLRSKVKAMGTLSFCQRLKFLFTWRSEYL